VVILDIGRNISGHKAPLATPQDMAETERLVRATGRRALTIQADIRDMSAMRAAAERTVRELGKIDILFANAGISGQGTIAESSDDDWRRTVDVNVIGTANSLRAVAPNMIARGAGRIIVTASTFGRQGTGAHVPYATEKWGLVGMVKSAALELGRNNITVNAVAPTGVVTGFGGPQTPQQRAQGDEFFRTQYHALPVGALQPEDIGGTVVFLASPAARYITGAVIDVAAGANARYTG
jgi:NAD(P)-dependent dehydrogenase (short-subunit alcohol dehydrogenase family)